MLPVRCHPDRLSGPDAGAPDASGTSAVVRARISGHGSPCGGSVACDAGQLLRLLG